MFGKPHVIRFSQYAIVLLMVALLACAGCQCFSQKSPKTVPPSTVSPTITPLPTSEIYPPALEEPGSYSAFRPIMPGPFVPPIPAQTHIVQETPKIESPKIESPKTESLPAPPPQSKIDELNRRITELESLIDELKRSPAPVVVEKQPPLTENQDVPKVKSLPIIKQQDVQVSSDDSQNIRFAVTDKTLFIPDTWQLSAAGEETLRTIAAEIRASDPKAILDIEGHTDSLMDDPNNLMQKHEASTAKVTAVMNFFVTALRWDAARLGTSSFGRSRPVADNGTAEGREKNSRIEIVVRKEAKNDC